MSLSWLFQKTHRVRGSRRWIDEKNTGLKFLRYGRIVLEGGYEPIFLEAGKEEIGLICLWGEGSVEVNGRIFGMKKYDALYLPIQSRCRVVPKEFFDLAECTAPASKDYGVQFVSFDDVLKNPKLVNGAGFEPYSRTIHTLIGEANTKAGRLRKRVQ